MAEGQDPSTIPPPPAGTEPAAAPRRRPRKEKADVVSHFVTKFGDADEAVYELATENLEYREKNDALKARQLPDGHVALPKADADALAGYKALGLAPDALKSRVDLAATLEAKEAKRAADEAVTALGTQMGYPKPGALVKLADQFKFTPADVREEPEDAAKPDGRKRKVLYVRPAGDAAAQPVALEKFATDRDFTDFLAVLTAPSGGNGNGNGDGTGGTPAATTPPARLPYGATPFPPQRQGGEPPAPAGRTPEQIVADKRRSGSYAL